MNIKFDMISRFKDASWLTKEVNVVLIGLGGIGSHTALLLYKTVPLKNLYLIDKDSYEYHNIGTQLIFPNYINLFKCFGSKLLLNTFSSGVNNEWSIIPINENVVTRDVIKPLLNNLRDFGSYGQTQPIIFISAVDSMKVRNYIYQEIKQNIKDIKNDIILIDGRLNATSYEIFTVNLFNNNETTAYEKSLLKDNEVPDGVCTMRQTFHFGSMIASKIVQVITNWLSNLDSKENEIKLYKVPFFIQEIGDGFIFKTMTAEEYLNRINKLK